MSTTIYKLKPKTAKGVIYMLFVNGYLKAVEVEFNTPLTDAQQDWLRARFPFQEEQLEVLASGFLVDELKPKTVQEKTIMFSMYHKAKKRVAYKASKIERANIKNFEVNEMLLAAYYDYESFPLSQAKSMLDYIKHYNHVRDLAVNGKKPKKRFPDEYSVQFERTLTAKELPKYWQHLRELGWTKQQIGTQQVWQEPDLFSPIIPKKK